MIYIVLATVFALVLLQATGGVPRSSVGGSMAIAMVLIPAMLAVGLHEAWTARRGIVGWIVNIPVSFLGGLLAAQLGGFALIVILSFINTLVPLGLKPSLAATGGPILYLSLAAVACVSLLGARIALQIVNRWR